MNKSKKMGIKGLNNFLRKKCVEVFNNIELKDLAYKKLAIDISLYMCKYKVVCGDRWLSAFLNLVKCLRKNNIHCVFIYDTTAPPEKEGEREERRKHKEKLESSVFNLKNDLEEFYRTGEVSPLLVETSNNKGFSTTRRLLSNKVPKFQPRIIEEEIAKKEGQVINITKKDIIDTKKLFDILKVPYYNAPMEAETMCSELCINGVVDAVLSEDTDVLAYGTPVFVSKIDTRKETATCVIHKQILEELEMTKRQFTELCIMSGTDYNKNIPKVGPMNSYKLLQKHGSIDEIKENTKYDVSILNHKRGLELFEDFKKSNLIKIPYCGKPNYEDLEKFLIKKNIYYDINNIKSCFN